MNEKVLAALRKIAEDETLAAKLQACADPDEAYAIVSSVENGFTREEFIAALEALRASARSDTDVSNEELSKMAGGGEWTGNTSFTTLGPTFTTNASVTAVAPNF